MVRVWFFENPVWTWTDVFGDTVFYYNDSTLSVLSFRVACRCWFYVSALPALVGSSFSSTEPRLLHRFFRFDFFFPLFLHMALMELDLDASSSCSCLFHHLLCHVRCRSWLLHA